MKKEIIKNLVYFLIYFLLITLANRLFSFSHYLLYVGGLVGLFMPNLDHLLYVFVFKPYELTSQRVKTFISQKQYKEALTLLYDTRSERYDLIFHSINFQIIFTILTFWVISSSGSWFGKGLVLSFYLTLVKSNYSKLPKNISWITVVLLLVFGFML